MSQYYNRQGKPITLQEWAKALETKDAKRVIETTLPNGYWVSTVWLGLDHRFGDGEPLIFETMVFPHDKEKSGGEGVTSWSELDMDRYSTEAEALAGHERIVAEWAAK